MITPHALAAGSPYLEERCALCKDPFLPGQELVVCPEDGSRHHRPCWEANGNRCAALACPGAGEVGRPAALLPARAGAATRRSKVRVLPSVDLGWRRAGGRARRRVAWRGRGCGCVWLLLVLMLLCTTAACAGLWWATDSLIQALSLAPPPGMGQVAWLLTLTFT